MTTIAGYILERLRQQGVDTLFGVVGVPCADFFDAAPGHGLKTVPTTSDLEAGYAADGYARLRGLSAVTVSYGPGSLSLVNALAGAQLEKSAVVLVSGGPTSANLGNERSRSVLFSHSSGRDATDFHVMEQVTAASARITSAANAPAEIDRVLRTAISVRRPVYLEVGKDLWGASCSNPAGSLQPSRPVSGQEEALATQILQRLSAAQRPVLLLGEEIQRFGLQGQATSLLAKLKLPWATTVLGKAVLAEQEAGFRGTYSGDNSNGNVKTLMDGADFILALGCIFSSGYLALANAKEGRLIRAWDGMVRIRENSVVKGDLATLIDKMNAGHWSAQVEIKAENTGQGEDHTQAAGEDPEKLIVEPGIAYDDVFAVLGAFLDGTTLLIADTSLSILPAADLKVVGRDAFMAGAAWASIGHSVGAAVGATFATNRRLMVLCGDGGFQMTATALSTLVRHGRRCTVLVIDNALYGYEQYLLGKSYFRDVAAAPLSYAQLQAWDYTALATAMGVKNVAFADSAQALTAALTAARTWPATGLISIKVQPHSLPRGWPP